MDQKQNNSLSTNVEWSLMKARMGGSSAPVFLPSTVKDVNTAATRLDYYGGYQQQDRMIRDKRKSLDKALLYSYQAAFVSNLKWLEQEEPQQRPPVRALMNPNKLKPNYDDKIISIGYEHGFKPGDIFKWENTGTYWLIYLQDLTELAYFRGDVRKCRYIIKWKDEDDNIYSTYAAIRGPVETKINYIQKNGISVDTPNHTLNFYIPATEATLKYFQRYNKFYLQEDKTICWRVEAWDSISMPGIIEVNATEYYANKDLDDLEAGIANGLVMTPVSTSEDPKVDEIIVGENFIKPQITQNYKYVKVFNGTWSINWMGKEIPSIDERNIGNDSPIRWQLISKNQIRVKWIKMYSGQFDIIFKTAFGTYVKTIIVKSLF